MKDVLQVVGVDVCCPTPSLHKSAWTLTLHGERGAQTVVPLVDGMVVWCRGGRSCDDSIGARVFVVGRYM